MLTTKIGDINNKLNQEYKNCNLYVKNLPYELTEDKMKEIFSKCGEVKSVKISQFLLVTKVNDKFVNYVSSHGFGYVCYTSEEGAKKAITEFNGKYLPGFENTKRPPIMICPFMPKHERKQLLNQQAAPTMPNSSMFPGIFPMYAPNMYNRQFQNKPRVYRRPQDPSQKQIQQQTQTQKTIQNPPPVNQNNVPNGNKEDEPSFEYLQSLANAELQKDYLGEYLFKKIEQHPLAHSKNLTVDIISRITGMILGIDDIKEIYDITVNNQSITARINEALELLGNQQ